MSDFWVNIRIGLYHFQASPTLKWRFRISRNDYHGEYPEGFFAIYELFGWTLARYGWERTSPSRKVWEKPLEVIALE